MPEILTESFCERCGTKYTLGPAEEPRKPAGVKKAKLLARGFKNFVMSDDAFEDALAAAELDEDRERAAEQLEAFHQVFNFCMECRQYTCTQCWNNAEGRCLTCAPLPFGIEKDPLFRLGDLAPGAGAIRPAESDTAHPTVVDASAWPTADLARSRPTPPADLQPLGLPEWLAQSAARAGGDGADDEGAPQLPQLSAGKAPPEAAAASAGTPDVAQQPPQPSLDVAADIAAQSPEQQAAPAMSRELAATPETPLPSELAAEPESAEDTARRAALDELVTDLTGGAVPADFAAPAAWRGGERGAPQTPEPAPEQPAAAPATAEDTIPGAAFEVPGAAQPAAEEPDAPAKGRKRGRGQRSQPVGPLPGMSWQAWRATVARREGAEVEEPLEVPAPPQPASPTLHEGMILEPIVPDTEQHPDWAAAQIPPAAEAQPRGPQPAGAQPAPAQPDESLPATRILERLRGAFGRSHAEQQPRAGQQAAPPAQAQPSAPAPDLREEPAAALPDAIGFPEPEPLGHPEIVGQPFAASQPAPAVQEPDLQRPAWPPLEQPAEPAMPSVEDEPLELPQVAAAEQSEARPEPVAPWNVTPEAPKAPAAEPSWPAAPKDEPAWPAAPRQEPAWPEAPRQEPAWPTPRQEPAWPAAPAGEPASPARPRRDAWPPAPSAPAEPAPTAPSWPPAPTREPVWPPRAPVYQPPAAEPAQAPARPGRPAPAPQQPAPPPAFVARQAPGPAAWPPAAQSAQPPASSVWEESSRGVIGRPGSGVQACVSCGLALSASARFCRRCGTRQA